MLHSLVRRTQLPLHWLDPLLFKSTLLNFTDNNLAGLVWPRDVLVICRILFIFFNPLSITFSLLFQLFTNYLLLKISSIYLLHFFKYLFFGRGLVIALLIGRQVQEMGSERGGHKQQRATGQTRTLGCCSEDKTSIHGIPLLPTELLGCPWDIYLNYDSVSLTLVTSPFS